MRVLARRTATGMTPADEQASTYFRSWPVGTVAYVEIKTARNPRQHRMLFALLNTMVEHGEFASVDGALVALKLATGHVKEVRIRGDEVAIIPDSISYANMGQIQFESWFNSALETVCSRWLAGWKSEDLKRHVLEMVG